MHARCRFAVLLLLVCSQVHAQVSDLLLFDTNDKFINPEFSADGRHVTFTAVPDPAMPDERFVMYGKIDETGFPSPGIAQGRVVAPMAPAGLAYWGETAHAPDNCPDFSGQFNVFLGITGYFTVLYARTIGDPCIAAVGPSDDPADSTTRLRRRIPFPMANPQADGLWISYQNRNQEEKKVRKYVVDLSVSPIAPVLIDEEDYLNESGQRPTAFLHWPWWSDGTSDLLYLTFDGCVANCPYKIAKLSIDQLATGTQLVGTAGGHMVGLYPFRLNTQDYLYFGLNDSPFGLFYEELPDGTYGIVRTLTYESAQSTLIASGGTLDIFNVQSMEAFDWQGEPYAAYTVSERNVGGKSQAFANQTEVWVVKLDGLQTGAPLVRCRVSENDVVGTPMSRTEPEPVVIGDEAYIFYSAGQPTSQESSYAYRWRRLHLGDKALFDAACAAGTVWSEVPAANLL